MKQHAKKYSIKKNLNEKKKLKWQKDFPWLLMSGIDLLKSHDIPEIPWLRGNPVI